MHRLGEWFLQHPISFGCITLFFSCLVSVYAEAIRKFVAISPQRLSVWVLKARIDAAVSRLQYLTYLRQDFSALFLYFVLAILIVLLCLTLIGAFLVLQLLLIQKAKPLSVTLRIYLPLVLASAHTILFRALLMAAYLTHPESSLPYFQKKVVRLQCKLEAKEDKGNVAQVGI
jgi:hypothetical protein